MPLRKHLVCARLATGAEGDCRARLYLLVLRQAWWRLDLLPDGLADGQERQRLSRVELFVRHPNRPISRLRAVWVTPVVTSRIDDRLYAVVNVNAFEGVDPSLLRRASTTFDDETESARLARRKRNWIAKVDYDV